MTRSDNGRTGGDVSRPGTSPPEIPTSAANGQHGATQAADGAHFGGRLERLAELHEELAKTYRGLGLDLANRLAVSAPASLHVSVPEKPRNERLLSVNDVAEMIAVDEKTVRNWRQEGLLPPALVVRGIVRWQRAAIDEWIEARTES